MARARKLRMHLYLEGIRIPLRQVSVSAQVNRPATATLKVPPTKLLDDIPPKTHVLVFYEDLQIDDLGEDRPFEDKVRLLFEGEVTGNGSSQQANGSVDSVIYAQDLSNYFARAPAYFFRNNEISRYGIQSVGFLLGPDGVNNVKFGSNPNFTTGAGSEVGQILLQSKPESVPRAFLEIYSKTQELNTYFRLANQRLRLVDSGSEANKDIFGFTKTAIAGRVAVKNDPEAAILFDPRKLTDQADHMVHNNDIMISLLEVMSKVMQLVQYQMWPQLCPSYEEDESTRVDGRAGTGQKRIVNFAIKPTSFFSVPPRFNVLFPGSFSSVETTRNFMEEPTRLRLRFPEFQGGAEAQPIGPEYFAPAGLNDLLRAVYGNETLATWIDLRKQIDRNAFSEGARVLTESVLDASALLADFEKDLTQEQGPLGRYFKALLLSNDSIPPESIESLKGIIPKDVKIPHNVFVKTVTEASTSNQDRYYAQLAEFLLFLAQHAARITSLTSDFNPNIALGFPMLVLHESLGPKFGEVAQLTHTLTNDAGGSTAIALSYTHAKDAIFDEVYPPGIVAALTDAPPENLPEGIDRRLPAWINKAYRPQFVDENEFNASRIDPDGDFKTRDVDGVSILEEEEIPRGQGAWRYFFGKSGTAFWRAIPDFSDPESVLEPSSSLIRYSKRTAADMLLLHYRSLDDASRQNMVEDFSRRRVATMSDVVEFLKLSVDQPEIGEPVEQIDDPVGTFFRSDVRAFAQQLKAKLVEPAVRI